MAKWLIPPLTDTDKHLDKEWGLHLLLDSDDPRDKTGVIFGAPDQLIKQKITTETDENIVRYNSRVICYL